ncbi:hypothetical protein [Lacticaseibacillus camelliae]|uniref:hypothetical protein n=1 Tax=Lacticaseibacillus camelliae TaxID=381742 RepID=UPI0006D1B249|nr:hypothetical protein [Lacticaseibacillus camelliae]
MKKGGALTAKSEKKLLQQSQLTALLAHNQRLIINAATAILNGVISLAPLQFKHESDIITRSDYQAIMRFDPATGGDQYHHVAPLSPEEVLAKILAEQEDKNNE